MSIIQFNNRSDAQIVADNLYVLLERNMLNKGFTIGSHTKRWDFVKESIDNTFYITSPSDDTRMHNWKNYVFDMCGITCEELEIPLSWVEE